MVLGMGLNGKMLSKRFSLSTIELEKNYLMYLPKKTMFKEHQQMKKLI